MASVLAVICGADHVVSDWIDLLITLLTRFLVHLLHHDSTDILNNDGGVFSATPAECNQLIVVGYSLVQVRQSRRLNSVGPLLNGVLQHEDAVIVVINPRGVAGMNDETSHVGYESVVALTRSET